jgi:hypothetical protein
MVLDMENRQGVAILRTAPPTALVLAWIEATDSRLQRTSGGRFMKRLVAGILLLGAGIPASTDSLDAVVAKVLPSIVSIRELIGTNSPLFDGTDETTLSGTWRSLTSNTRKELRQDGRFLTGFYSNDPDFVSYDLVLQEDGHYRGHVKAALTMYGHSDQWRKWESRVCVFETKIVLRAVTPNRIEGRIHGYEDSPGDDRSADKNTCLGPEPLRWIDFVWVRVE